MMRFGLRRAGAWVVMAAGVATAACAGIPRNVQDPAVQLRGLSLTGIGLEGGTFTLGLDLTNPNGFALNASALDLGLEIGGDTLGTVQSTAPIALPAGGTAQVDLPVRFRWGGVVGAVRSALVQGDVPYTVNGRVTLRVARRDVPVPFTRTGRLPASVAMRLLDPARR